MMALNSLMPFCQESQGLSPEQGLGLYLAAGVFSSFCSHLYALTVTGNILIGSLGASGAIWGLVAR
jgi:membrane associated rhomboid family serine protease